MRKIRDLVTDRERVWIYLASEEESRDFLERAAAEGFRWANGSPILPTERYYVLAIHSDFTLWQVSLYCWTRSFQGQETIPGTPVRIEYGKYISGAADSLCREPHWTGVLIL